jgi:hypothetical protein
MTQDEIIEMTTQVYGECNWHKSALLRLEAFVKLVEDKALAQRTWVGLTDEEIKTICSENGWDSSWQSMRFAHAIEAKLKEKNT